MMRIRILALVLLSPSLLLASQTQWWRISSQEGFAKGDLKGVAVTTDGRLLAAATLEEVFDTGEAFIYDAILDKARNLYLATGNNGRIFQVPASGAPKEFAKIEGSGVFALAVDSQNRLYAGTGPDGKVYRFDSSGNPEVFYDPGEKYIWSLAMDAGNNLHIGTGPKGVIYKVDPQGQGRAFYDSTEAHVSSLKIDLNGNLLAGTAPNGLVMRIAADGRPSVLYDSPMTEIKALDVDRIGLVYAVALNSLPQTEAEPGGKEAEGGGDGLQPADKLESAGAQAGKGLELYRIDRDDLVQRLYSSDDESGYDVKVRDDGTVLLGTGPRGRILAVGPNRYVTYLAQTGEEQATRMAQGDGALYVASSNLGKVFRLRNQPGSGGVFESAVLDASTTSQWGQIQWRTGPNGEGIRVSTRSGNTRKVDETWERWSNPYSTPTGSAVASKAGRYLQFRIEFPGAPAGSSVTAAGSFVDSVEISYLQRNLPPRFLSLTVHPPGKALEPVPTGGSGGALPGGPDGAHARSLPQEVRELSGPQPVPPPRPVYIPGARSVAWKAEDPNGDDLVYSLLVRRQGEDLWKPVRTDLREDFFTLDGAAFASGVYTIKVVASDRLSNPPQLSQVSEMVSAAFTMSDSGPTLEVAAPRIEGRIAVLEFSARGSTAPLFQSEYQLDGGEWTILLPQDGITDGPTDAYALRLENLPVGDHVLSVRVVDSVGIIATQRTVLRIR